MAKVVKIHENTTTEHQIKGQKQPEHLTSWVDYITKKFDEYEEERKKERQAN